MFGRLVFDSTHFIVSPQKDALTGLLAPSHSAQEEIEEELRQLGISAEVQRDSSKNGLGNAKEQLIQRLEEARMDTSRLSAEQLDTELKAMGLAVDGPQVHNLPQLAVAC